MGRIMAIDYGLKRVGIAVTDPLQIISSPLETIENSQIFPYLESYLVKENVDEVVVGMPKNLQNEDTHITADVKTFVEKLAGRFPGTKICTMDERFTSKVAFSTIVSSGVNKKKRKDKKLVDKVSASLILQTYMEQKGIL